MKRLLPLLLLAVAAMAVAEDTDRLTALSGRPGPLEFRLEAGEAECKDWKETGKPPRGTSAVAVGGGSDSVLVRDSAVLDGRHVKSAAVSEVEPRAPGIDIEFTDEGTILLSRVTGDNIGRRLVVLAGTHVLSAPRIMAGLERRVRIHAEIGEATRLVAVIKAGVLPCRLVPGRTWNALAVADGKDAWDAEPLAQFPARVLRNHLMHAILEDALRKGDPRVHESILGFLEAREAE